MSSLAWTTRLRGFRGSWRGRAAAVGGAMADAVAPRVIEGALAEHAWWSPDAPEAYCGRCGATLGVGRPGGVPADDGACDACRHRQPPWSTVVRLGAYDEPLNLWLRDLKFHRQWVWGRWFGTRLAPAVLRAVQSDGAAATPIVVPVPMPWRRRWWRGYNQAALIAEALAAGAGWPCVPVLRRCEHTAPQTTVLMHLRARNVARSVEAVEVDLAGRPVVLVDDIKTTGGTLAACCRALQKRRCGAITVAVVAVARGLGGRGAATTDAGGPADPWAAPAAARDAVR